MVGKTRAKQFFQKHTNRASTKVGKDRREKGRKNVFYIHTNIVPQKRGETRETSFPETHE